MTKKAMIVCLYHSGEAPRKFWKNAAWNVVETTEVLVFKGVIKKFRK